MVEYKCPECREILHIPDQYRGQRGTCNKCGCTISVPYNPAGLSNDNSISSTKTGGRRKPSATQVVYGAIIFIFFAIAMPITFLGDTSDPVPASQGVGYDPDALSRFVSDVKLSNQQRKIETANSETQINSSRSSLEPFVDRSAPQFSESEHQIYWELKNASMSESDDEAHRRLARKYGRSLREIEHLIERMMKAEFARSGDLGERTIRALISADVKIKNITVSGWFANVSFIESSAARNDDDVRRKVLDRMPEVLGRVFKAETIQHVRLTGYYPSTSGDPMKVASFEALRWDFRPEKKPREYSEFRMHR